MSDKSLRDLMREKKISPDDLSKEQRAQYDKLRDKVGQYQGKNESDILREIDRLKMNKDVLAKLKGRDLDMFADSLRPMLNREQQRKLDELIRHLRSG